MDQLISTENFQQLLLQQVQRRLSGSSLLAVDEVETIRQSILFVMAHAREGHSAEDRFEDGKQVLAFKLFEVKKLYQELRRTYQDFGIESLKGTIVELGDFFANYDIDYDATVSGSGWIDYQLANPVDDLQYKGIDFVEQYIRRLTVENEFMAHIPTKQVLRLLENYTHKLGFDYRMDINNLYQIVFDQWVAKMIAHTTGTTLLMTEPEAEFVYSCIKQNKIPDELVRLLENQPYHKQTFQRFIQRIQSIDTATSLRNALIMEAEQATLILTPAMSEVAFNHKMARYQLVTTEAEQVDFLLHEIPSPYDLLEFLEEKPVPMSFYQQLSFDQGLGLILVVNQFQEERLKSWEEILCSSHRGLKRFVEGLEAAQRDKITDALNHLTIGERDFS
jgi:hypothetical protein